MDMDINTYEYSPSRPLNSGCFRDPLTRPWDSTSASKKKEKEKKNTLIQSDRSKHFRHLLTQITNTTDDDATGQDRSTYMPGSHAIHLIYSTVPNLVGKLIHLASAKKEKKKKNKWYIPSLSRPLIDPQPDDTAHRVNRTPRA